MDEGGWPAEPWFPPASYPCQILTDLQLLPETKNSQT